MLLRIHTYVYTYTYIRVYISTCIDVYACTYISKICIRIARPYSHIYVFFHVYTHTCKRLHFYVNTYPVIQMCMYAHMSLRYIAIRIYVYV